ncbi:hypothetical protein WAI453_007652 [Rhynchosporium graminicola]
MNISKAYTSLKDTTKNSIIAVFIPEPTPTSPTPIQTAISGTAMTVIKLQLITSEEYCRFDPQRKYATLILGQTLSRSGLRWKYRS